MAQPDNELQLLLGLLALQTGLIDHDQLLAAFRDWSRDRSMPLTSALLRKGALEPDQLALLEGLAAQHLKKHGGDAGQSLAALAVPPSTVKSLAKECHPDAEATLTKVGKGPGQSEENDNADGSTLTYTAASVPGTGGRFRVLRPHARGGLGAVFVALDAELNREVALKQILEHHADDTVSRDRFLLEAEITGGLEHPNIVPVYGLRHDADGRPYYAMRFIRGDSLKEAVDHFHADESLARQPGARNLELQKLLRRFLSVCDAVGYAHQRGILHRDIKPANIILGRHGETLLVDWGLAKSVASTDNEVPSDERTLHPSSASGSVDTLPGSAMGTPAYMSPEQAMGDLENLSPRSDVYSLGATLYYILTGRPPLEGSVPDILRRVKLGEIKPPRSTARWVDPALEAICLKAMSRLPDDRYHTARSLSIDLERSMADEPVTAYREPWRRRLARWERRHKALVHGGGVVLLIAAAAFGITASVIGEQKKATERARELAEEKAVEAASNFEIATDAAYNMLSMVSDQDIIMIPGMTKVRIKLADTAVHHFQKFISTKTADPVLMLRTARVYMNAAYAHRSTGDLAAANRYYKDQMQLLEQYEKTLGDGITAEHRQALTSAILSYLGFLEDHGLTDLAVYRYADYHAEARKRVEELMATASPTSPSDAWRFLQAGQLEITEAHVALANGNFKDAGKAFEKARESFAIGLRVGSFWFWNDLWHAQAHRGLARVAHLAKEERAADDGFDLAISMMRDVFAKLPNQYDPGYVLSWTLALNADRLASLPDRREQADAAFAEALELIKKPVADFPDETRYRGMQASILQMRGLTEVAQGKEQEAERDLQQARSIFLPLVDTQERLGLVWPIRLARVEIALARIKAKKGQADDARKLFSVAAGRLEQMKSEHPRSAELNQALIEGGDDLRQP